MRGDVTFAQHGIDGTAQHLAVLILDRLLRICRRGLGKVGDLVALALELSDALLQLRNGRADVRQLDDVGLPLRHPNATLIGRGS